MLNFKNILLLVQTLFSVYILLVIIVLFGVVTGFISPDSTDLLSQSVRTLLKVIL